MAGSTHASRSRKRLKRVGVLVVSTGTLARSLEKTTRGLLGRVPNLKSLCLKPEDHWQDAVSKLQTVLDKMDRGSGILILTDVAGGTPYNAAQSLRGGEHPVEVIGGVNVPMLIKAVDIADGMPLDDAAPFIERYGRDHISRAGVKRK